MPKQKRRSPARYRPTPEVPRYELHRERADDPVRRTEETPRLGPYEIRYPVDLGYAIQSRMV